MPAISFLAIAMMLVVARHVVPIDLFHVHVGFAFNFTAYCGE